MQNTGCGDHAAEWSQCVLISRIGQNIWVRYDINGEFHRFIILFLVSVVIEPTEIQYYDP